ncbi:class I SAM-dependent methyltransferase [Dyella humi]|uniref:Methyltransferase domain-containing protein n=1 Tax=Dyella humi TaxID=1770547 RepID=A0ABW8ING3_9GAMM
MNDQIEAFFPDISQPLLLPENHTEHELLSYLESFELDGAPAKELSTYLSADFRRFVHTLSIVPEGHGRLLEIGANPYFTTILLKKFRQHEIYCTNYFGISGGGGRQSCKSTLTNEVFDFDFLNNNVDVEDIPFEETFDIILFCEVIEHLVADPLGALRRIKDKLNPGGALILTTPNVNRLENIARMMCGGNIYDPISGYGVYGRHNREYNKHELFLMLSHLGFDLDLIYSSDVHENHARAYYPIENIAAQIHSTPNRGYDLGQYIFLRARNSRLAAEGKPRWLYRSYPDAELCD